MRDTAADANASQVFEDRVNGATAMHKNWKIEFSGDFQLFDEKAFLPGKIGAFEVPIQADFADRHRRRCWLHGAGQTVFEYLQIAVFGVGGEQRVDAVRRVAAGVTGATRTDPGETGAINRRDEQLPHADGTCRGDDVVPIGVEWSGVEVAVAVNQHYR